MEDIHLLVRHVGIDNVHACIVSAFSNELERIHTYHINHMFTETLLTFILSRVAMYAPKSVFSMVRVCKLWLKITYNQAFWMPLARRVYRRTVRALEWPAEIKTHFLNADIFLEWSRDNMMWVFDKTYTTTMHRPKVTRQSDKTFYQLQLVTSYFDNSHTCTCGNEIRRYMLRAHRSMLIGHFTDTPRLYVYYGDVRDYQYFGMGTLFIVSLGDPLHMTKRIGKYCHDKSIGLHHCIYRDHSSVLEMNKYYENGKQYKITDFKRATPTEIYRGPVTMIGETYLRHATADNPATITYRETGMVYTGPTIDGLPHGKGTMTDPETGTTRNVHHFAGILQSGNVNVPQNTRSMDGIRDTKRLKINE